jgi:hypothetical protein
MTLSVTSESICSGWSTSIVPCISRTAEIVGKTTLADWRDALDRVQARHPLLSVRIDRMPGWLPRFRRVEEAPIPLKVRSADTQRDVGADGAQWIRRRATISAATVNGSLCLTHTSYTPPRGLLETMDYMLAEAAAA